MVDKSTLQKVNSEGNASSPFENEDNEDWRPEASYTGKDCDSYASYKKRQLLRMDWNLNEVMCIASCDVDGNGVEDHAVLLVYVKADNKVYVLDNRFYWVEPIEFYRKNHGYDFHRVPQYMQEFIKQAARG